MFILFSAGNLGTAAFREPQRHSPAQHILYLLRHIPSQLSKLALQDAQACLPTPGHSQTDRACCAPCCSLLSQETDRALALLFHFVPTPATGNSKFFPRVRAWCTNSQRSTGLLLHRRMLVLVENFKKLFKFRQVSTVDYQHCPVPMHICLPHPGCKKITCRAYTFQKTFVLIRMCSKLISLQVTGKLS